MIDLAGQQYYDDPTIVNDQVMVPWTYRLDTRKIFGGRMLHVSARGKNIVNFMHRKDEPMSSADVHAELAKWLVTQAHKHHPALSGANHMLMDAYRMLGCDQRVVEAHALIKGPQGIMVYRAPKWRQDNEDTGSEKTIEFLMEDLKQYLPQSVLPKVRIVVSNYMSVWEKLYGQKPQLTSFVKRLVAGVNYFVVIGGSKGAVHINFNYCDVLDQHTLRPNDHIVSVLKDFNSRD